MDARRPRSDLVPNANNPRLLLRLLGFMATGVRRPAALAEVLEVELRTVHYYTQAAEWLGLIEGEPDLRLSPRGLALAYADPEAQAALYAEAAWATPLAAAIMQGRDALPEVDELAARITEREPGIALATARRRASALRGLLAPAITRRPAARAPRGDQLHLPFPAAPPPAPAPQVDLRAGVDESPDVYRRVLVALLDHGELGTGQLRALLDAMGAGQAGLSGYVEMAERRGDAFRIEERLVATRGAQRRRDTAEDSVLVALTDPLYRSYLTLLDRAAEAARRPGASAEEAALRNRLLALSRRFAPWDQRIFGRRLQPGEVGAALTGLLLGRGLQGLPLAEDPGAPVAPRSGAFLDLADEGELAVAFPSSLADLAGGVAAVNRRLQRDREAPAAVRLPGPVDRRSRVHGGLVAPGEPPPRAVPDNLSLRLRALTHAPALSLLGALLLAGRRGPGGPVVLASDPQDPPLVRLRGELLGPPLDLLGRFVEAQGWLLLRPPCDGLSDAALATTAEALGIATRAAGRLLLDELLFARLQEDPECRLVYDALLPLEDRLMGWLAGV